MREISKPLNFPFCQVSGKRPGQVFSMANDRLLLSYSLCTPDADMFLDAELGSCGPEMALTNGQKMLFNSFLVYSLLYLLSDLHLLI